MFSRGSPLMRTKELILDVGWRRSPHADSGSEAGFLGELDDDSAFARDDEEPFEFFANFPPELTVHVFRHLLDVRDLNAVSQVCRRWYCLTRQCNGLWHAVYLQMPGWSIRPDARAVLERHARELASAEEEKARQDDASGSVHSPGGRDRDPASHAHAHRISVEAGPSHQQHQSGSSIWPSLTTSTPEPERSASVAPLPYLSLAPPPLSGLGRSRGRKSWIAAHLPDLSSLTLGNVGGGGVTSAGSSRASSHSRTSSWDIASNMRSRVLSGAASMAQSASEQLQRRRRKSVHVDVPHTDASILLDADAGAESDPRRASTSLLSRTLPTLPSPLRAQLAEDDQEEAAQKERRRRKRLSFSSDVATFREERETSIAERALKEHERVKSATRSRRNADVLDHLDWRRLCIARWALDRRWGLPIPPRRPERPDHPARMLSRSSSIGNEMDFYRPVGTYLKGHEDTIYCLRMDSAFFEGAGRIVSGSRDCTVKVWNRSTGACVHTLTGYSQSVLCLDYDSELLVTGSSDASILVWDFTFGLRRRTSMLAPGASEKGSPEPEVVARLTGHADKVLNIAMNRGFIASCGKEKVVRVWDRRTGDCLRQFREHTAVVNGIALTGNRAVSVSGDPTFYIWDLQDEAVVEKVQSDQNEGLVCVVAHGDTIITGSRKTSVKIWNARSGSCERTLNRHQNMVRALAYDARRGLLVSGGYDNVVLCWYVPLVGAKKDSKKTPNGSNHGREIIATPRVQQPPFTFSSGLLTPQSDPSSSSPTRAGAAESNSPLFADSLERSTPSYTEPWRVPFDDADPEPLAEFRDHTHRVVSVAVDGTHLASASYDKRICVRNFAVALPSDPFTSVDLELVGGGDQPSL